jgi:hypothetical protein
MGNQIEMGTPRPNRQKHKRRDRNEMEKEIEEVSRRNVWRKSKWNSLNTFNVFEFLISLGLIS